MYTKLDHVGIAFYSPPLLTACKGPDPQLVLVIPQLSQKTCNDYQLSL